MTNERTNPGKGISVVDENGFGMAIFFDGDQIEDHDIQEASERYNYPFEKIKQLIASRS